MVLKCAEQFSQGMDDTGTLVSYHPGASIADETWQKWNADTLANRLAGGFVKWDTEVDAPNAAPAGEGDGDPEQMGKDGLVEYTQRVYGVTLDKRVSEKSMREQLAVLKERARLTLVAEQEKAAREAAANASTGGTGATS